MIKENKMKMLSIVLAISGIALILIGFILS